MQNSQYLVKGLRAAKDAGKIILQYYKRDYRTYTKKDNSPVSDADIAANDFLQKTLNTIFPCPILSEETKDNLTRLEAKNVWIVDPLDGTMDFLNHTKDFAIMIGLVADTEPLIGIVHEPARGRTYFAQKGKGTFVQRNNQTPQKLHTITGVKPDNLRLITSRFHSNAREDTVAEKLHISKRIKAGSVGVKIGMITDGAADIYVNTSNKMSEWDTCAPEIILQEAGGIMTDLRGKKLRYNQKTVKREYGVIALGDKKNHRSILAQIKNISPLVS